MGREGNGHRNCIADGLALLGALIAALIVWQSGFSNCKQSSGTMSPSHDDAAGRISAYKFAKAAVAADSKYCSDIGRDILKKGGSAVDGAVAALICCGVVQVHSTGIGGGGFMTVYDAKLKEAVVFDYRETGPAALRPDSYDANHDAAKVGGMAVGVPGEIRGLRKAWRRYGKLPWRRLIQPSIDLARKGTKISQHMADLMRTKATQKYVMSDPGLRELLVSSNGAMKKAGDVIKNEKYATTLEVIRDNPKDLYVGKLARSILQDVEAEGGVMTEDDLKDYKVLIRKPIKFHFDGLTIYTTPLPGGGVVLAQMLKMAEGFNFDKSVFSTMDGKILTYHRMVEVFKFSYAIRPLLGDPQVEWDKHGDMAKAVRDALSKSSTNKLQQKINDSSTQIPSYYSNYFLKHDGDGTTHVSALDEHGNAASATNSINYSFGAKFRSLETGIVYNNELADFFHNGTYPSEYPTPVANRPGPGKRPLSATCPSIAVDNEGNVKMVIGASGGTRITLSAAWVMVMNRMLGIELGHAVNLPRPQHALFPEYIRNEKLMPMSAELIEGLEAKNHVVESSFLSAVVQAIYKDSAGMIHAKSDPRKQGVPAGY